MRLKKSTKVLLAAALFVTGTTSLLVLSKSKNCATSQTVTVETGDLEPVLNRGQEATFLENYYSCHSVEKNDTVYYKHSGIEDPLLLQVEAVPGEEMKFDGCNVLIDNETLRNAEDEKYCFEDKRKQLLELYTGELSGYLLLTQQTSGGFDSSRFGPVSKNTLEGKVVEEKKFLGIF